MINWNYEIKYYFTLDDLFNNITPINFIPYSGTNFFSQLNDYPTQGNVVGNALNNFDSSILEELSSVLYLKFSKFYTFSHKNDNVIEIRTASCFVNWKRRLFSILMSTYEKYSTLINLYKNNLSKLMDKVKTSNSGKSRFNDTPQDGGLFEDDNHTTTITQTETATESDAGTIMMRLAEIQTNLRDVIDDWANEFSIIFINPLNI